MVLYGDVIIFAGCHGKLMMRFPLILALDIDLRDDGVWQVAYDPGLCSFIFTSGQYSSKDQDAMIAWMSVSFKETVVDFRTAASSKFGGVAKRVNRCWCKHFSSKEGVLDFGLL